MPRCAGFLLDVAMALASGAITTALNLTALLISRI
jgi:hypothetical protein